MVDSSLFEISVLTCTNRNVCFVTLDNKTSFTSRYFMKMSNIRNGYPMSLTKVYLAVCSLKVYVNICIFFALLADDVLSCPHRLLRMICVYHVQLWPNIWLLVQHCAYSTGPSVVFTHQTYWFSIRAQKGSDWSPLSLC